MELVHTKPQALEVTTKHALPLRVVLVRTSAAEVVVDFNKHLLSALLLKHILFQHVEAFTMEQVPVVLINNMPSLAKLLKSSILPLLSPRLLPSMLVSSS